MSEAIKTSTSDAVLTVQICRPDKKNALTIDMYGALADAVVRASEDCTVRAVLFTGDEGVFTAGNDIEDFLSHPPHDPDAPVLRFLRGIAEIETPLVAAVDGAAIGIGTTMLLHCDFVLATERSIFSLPFVNLGLCPEAGSSLLLTRLAGYQEAARLLMLGEPFDVATASRLGLVGTISDPSTLLADATELARKLASKPRAALRATKALLRHPEESVPDRMRREVERFTELLDSTAARECLSAFLEKRRPDPSRFD